MPASTLLEVRHLLCLYLLFTLTLGGLIKPERRQQSEISITVSSSQIFTSAIESTTSTPTSTTVSQGSLKSSTPVTATASATTTPTISASAGAPNGSSTFEFTIPHGQLPIQPTITPGWAVSGALLIVTGIICALVGIKKRWLHTFLTTAFLASLGTTVLILYVTDPPASDAVQGAYVVAAGCTGLIVGGLAIIFQDLAEGLACLLAGFCFSMWLLTLRSGGLTQHSGGKVAFIILLSMASFCLYFTRWTRTYGLIASISFSGATTAVLGIDCFARAGLKEFWAYIWDLNDDIFPLGTVTYPLTRGIRAEIAAIMIIFAAGIVSQLKLWRLVRNRQESEPADHEGDFEAEDEKTARQLEEDRARELREWERKYGDGKIRQVPPSEDSGLGDMDSEKRMPRHSQRSTLAFTTTRSRSSTGRDSDASKFEYGTESPRAATPFSLAQATAAAMACSPTRNLKGTIKDSDDGVSSESSTDLGSPTLHEKEVEVRENDRRRVVSSVVPISTPGSRSSLDSNSGPGPLPLEQAERQVGGEGRPGNDEENGLGQVTQRRSTTIIRRLSNGSAKLFRNLSQRPTSHHAEGNQRGESRDGLVVKTWKVRNDTDSVAVNLDDLGSVSGDEDSEDDQMEESKVSSLETQNNEDTGQQKDLTVKPTEEITDKTLSEAHGDRPDHSQVEQEAGIPSTTEGYGLMFDEPYGYKEGNGEDQPDTTDVPASVGDSEAKSSGMPKSDEPSLLKNTLGQELSPIALYCRTNEWAKHLDTADFPEEPVAFQSVDGADEKDSDLPVEKPVPLDVLSLQQTATSANVPRAIPKTTSLVTEYLAKQRGIQRSSSGPLLQRYSEGTCHAPDHTPKPEPVVTTKASPYRSASETLNGLTSRLFTETIAEEGGVQGHQRAPAQVSGGGHQTSRVVPPEISTFPSAVDPLGLPQTPGISRHRTTSTLIDTREALLRSKSQGLLFNRPAMDALNGTPTVQSQLVQGSSGSPPIDIDDIPLSQRRKMIHQSSLTYESKNSRSRDMLRDPDSSPKLNHQSWIRPTSTTPPQPARQTSNSSSTTSDAVRQAKLANFRNSVAADLRASSSRNVLNNNTIITSPILPPTSSLLQQPTTVFDPYSFTHQLGVITQPQPQTQTQQIHPEMGRRSSTQRNTYGYGQQLQQLQDPSTMTGAVLETTQRRNSGQTQLLTQVAQAHRAHRAHRDAMRRLQAGAKAD